ncbi:hypothetical protein I4U23_005838 [Adineta vaga]|nr:hypothetical protein I4U23_005838 [Adineta vaga]
MFKSINSKSIQTYFDLICRDGFITAEIGKYLQLNQENILGGDEYNSHNKDITYVKIDLNQSKIDLMDNHIDLITCFVVLHHVPDLDLMLREIVRIMRLNGYLIVREHDCKKERSLTNKYLNFIHAFMRIAEIGEYAHRSNDNSTNDWELQKKEIIEETNSIQYRTRQEWKKKLEEVGFCLIAEIDYDSNIKNPQVLYHDVYQLQNKQ